MNTQVKEKWLNALRSGEYSQTTGRLFDGKSYCCLGVLCDLYAKEHNVKWDQKGKDYFQRMDRYYFLDNSEILPEDVTEWAGLRVNDPSITITEDNCHLIDENKEDFYNHYEMEMKISELNDANYSFKQIANVIEEEL